MVWSGFTFHYKTCLRVQRKGFHSTQKNILRNHILPMFRGNPKLQGIFFTTSYDASSQSTIRNIFAKASTYCYSLPFPPTCHLLSTSGTIGTRRRPLTYSCLPIGAQMLQLIASSHKVLLQTRGQKLQLPTSGQTLQVLTCGQMLRLPTISQTLEVLTSGQK